MKFTNDYVFNFDDNSADLDNITDDKMDSNLKDTKTFKDPKKVNSQKPKEKEMCDICGVYFANVEQHRRIHSVEGLTCTECDITFEDRRAFLRHNKKHKSSEKKVQYMYFNFR